ncbi:MAG: YitT family protein [Tannerellaceae bacterium]|jgi:uncharacterized membrane-anchored protein YitT (DUF2179 family)|nr:YitT family protein [Tannerellaceae bacterium]
MKKDIRKLYYSLQDYLVICFGTLLYGFGFNGFILSNEIVTGGLSGVSALIYFGTSIPVSVSYFLINVLLLAIAFKSLGFKFLVKTIFGVISLSLSLALFEWLFDWLLDGKPILTGEPFMSILIGGGICGTGLGLIFSANGSTGGTDIIAAIINKHKNISMGMGMMFFDAIIIGSSYILFHDVQKIIFGFVEMGVNSFVLDRVINANRQSVQFLIFSQKYDEISERIIKDLGRGCTLLDGIGGYSQKPTKVVVLLAKKSESLTIFRLIKEIDTQAFISQSVVRGVYGEGFDQIKT